jgi:hypothetical protein
MADGHMDYRDFFISRTGIDTNFVVWVDKLIAEQGKSYVLQDEHFEHQHFVGVMDWALKSGARVVALFSQAYLESDYRGGCGAEGRSAQPTAAPDPTAARGVRRWHRLHQPARRAARAEPQAAATEDPACPRVRQP